MRISSQIIAHVDADCFFASVELIERPELRGRPLIVAGITSNRGVVTSATYEARRFGIKAGMPVFQARRLCPQGIFLAGHFYRYQEISRLLFRCLENFSPVVEQTSIDEGYLDFSGLDELYHKSYAELARQIQSTVREKLQINVSIGVATSKILAKMASAFQKPEGITIITVENLQEFLNRNALSAIPGIGRSSEILLQSNGFQTAADIAHADTALLKKLLGCRGPEIAESLNGKTVYKVSAAQALPQSISRSRTLMEFTDDPVILYGRTVDLLLEVGRELRKNELWARRMYFFLRAKNFQMRLSRLKWDRFHRDDDFFLAELKKIFPRVYFREIFRSVGVGLHDFAWHVGDQLSLFSEAKERPELNQKIDAINRKYGRGTVTRASALFITAESKNQNF